MTTGRIYRPPKMQSIPIRTLSARQIIDALFYTNERPRVSVDYAELEARTLAYLARSGQKP